MITTLVGFHGIHFLLFRGSVVQRVLPEFTCCLRLSLVEKTLDPGACRSLEECCVLDSWSSCVSSLLDPMPSRDDSEKSEAKQVGLDRVEVEVVGRPQKSSRGSRACSGFRRRRSPPTCPGFEVI